MQKNKKQFRMTHNVLQMTTIQSIRFRLVEKKSENTLLYMAMSQNNKRAATCDF